MRKLTFVVLALAASALSVAARADEDAIKLKPGEGLAALEGNCAACHSLDYVQMNSPFQDEKGWQATMTKMVNVMGAPIDAADQAKILAYLNANYGKQ